MSAEVAAERVCRGWYDEGTTFFTLFTFNFLLDSAVLPKVFTKPT